MSSASPLGVVKDVSASFVIDLLLKVTVTYSFKHVPGSCEDFTIELPKSANFPKTCTVGRFRKKTLGFIRL